MATSMLRRELLNPCLLHLQKMVMELKCPICLNLLTQPVLLSCDHIFCGSCCLKSMKVDCPVCKSSCSGQDLRPVPHMDRLVLIYRGLEAAFEAALLRSDSNAHSSEISGKVNEIHGRALEKKRTTHSGLDHGIANTGLQDSFRKLSNGTVDDTEEAKIGLSIHAAPCTTVAPLSGCGRLGGDGKKTSGINGGEFTDINMNREPVAADMKKELHDPREKLSVSRSASEVPVSNNVACAFCQSSRETEGSGPMLHYANGRAISALEKNRSRVVHVHKKCAEWAPQIYYEGDTIKNLESEIARSAKLKCSRCGQKGAALGCLAKSCRRSFHVPCAVEIYDCRWDCENFAMYCPFHSSLKFPGEKTKAGKRSRASIESPGSFYLIPNQNGRKWIASSDKTKRWVLCGSALTALEKDCVAEFASLTNAVVSKTWDHNVTHVIASVDENGCCRRTLKVLMAILAGSWVVNINWIKACMEAVRPVDEEPYEIDRDIHGGMRGPKIGRYRVMAKEPPLFDGLLFYFIGDFEASYKLSLQDLVLAAGGGLQNDSCSRTCDNKSKLTASTIIVYSQVYPEALGVTEVDSIIEQRFREATCLAAETDARVVGHAWLLDSIAAFQLQPLMF